MLLAHQEPLVGRMKAARAVLATDLDGTFLGGSAEQRSHLYSYLEQCPHTALIFVTGRDIAHVEKLIVEDGVPRPQIIIADVGTTVVDGHTFQPIKAVDVWIEQHWQGDEKARDVLKAHDDHLTLQDVYGGRRRSYFISDVRKAYEAKAAVEAAGYDGIVSDDTYFDVLPRGIHKGATLLKLIDVLGLAPEHILAAGDTLNDLSLFHTGLKAVAVGNREPDLDAQLPDAPHVYRAAAPGTAGILEALKNFNLYFEPEHSL